MVFLAKLVYKDLEENEVCSPRLCSKRYIPIILGGTAPGLYGGVGLPGARGRAGGKFLPNIINSCRCISFFI